MVPPVCFIANKTRHSNAHKSPQYLWKIGVVEGMLHAEAEIKGSKMVLPSPLHRFIELSDIARTGREVPTHLLLRLFDVY